MRRVPRGSVLSVQQEQTAVASTQVSPCAPVRFNAYSITDAKHR
jgi:hypothetical protein